MDTIVNEDFTSVMLDNSEAPAKMMQFPAYNISTLQPLTSAQDAKLQAESFTHLFEELSIDYISKADQIEQGRVLDLANNSASVRFARNAMLLESDWMGVSDNSMSEAWVVYRQALRDVPAHENFPVLEESDWPVKPE